MTALRPPPHRSLALAGTLMLAGAFGLSAQGAVDPSVASRAVGLERQGERQVATDMLGRYLATAPDDGRAWLQLGRFYFLDSRDWHARGHTGEPSGALFLDFAATALDQSIRLAMDSGTIFRAMVETDRVLVVVEDSGWEAARARPPQMETAALPDYMVELGVNLLNSCPANGVLLTGSDLETMAVWYVTFSSGFRSDVLPIRPDFYATDSVYRHRMATALGVDQAAPVQVALTRAALRRPVCLSPLADVKALPLDGMRSLRLVRVGGSGTVQAAAPLTITSLLEAERSGSSAWTREVRTIYQAAARNNHLLCSGILALEGDRPSGACGQ